MNYRLLYSFFFSAFALLSLLGCSNAQLYSSKADIEKIDAKIENLEQSLQKREVEYTHTQQQSLDLLSMQQKEFFSLMQQQLKHLQSDQNTTKLLLEKHLTTIEPKKVIVYKEKKGVSKLDGKLVLGEVENIFIQPPGIKMRARIDTGADTSSIDARDVEEFERDGQKWVKFTLIDRKDNTSHTIETKVSRYVNIVQSSLPDGYDRRIVVKLKLAIGDFSDLNEFTLTNREHMNFPLLIGRNVLKDIAVVDVSGKDLAPLNELKNND